MPPPPCQVWCGGATAGQGRGPTGRGASRGLLACSPRAAGAAAGALPSEGSAASGPGAVVGSMVTLSGYSRASHWSPSSSIAARDRCAVRGAQPRRPAADSLSRSGRTGDTGAPAARPSYLCPRSRPAPRPRASRPPPPQPQAAAAATPWRQPASPPAPSAPRPGCWLSDQDHYAAGGEQWSYRHRIP